MTRPYSNDLRERVVGAVERGGMSRRQAAVHYGVGISTAIKWVQRLRRTGSVSPGKIGGYRPKKLRGGRRLWLLERCRGGDFTLRGLVAELSERGLQVNYRVVWEFVHAEKLSHKNVWPAPAARMKSQGVLVCINVSGHRAGTWPRWNARASGLIKITVSVHHIFVQAAETPVRPLRHLFSTSTDLVLRLRRVARRYRVISSLHALGVQKHGHDAAPPRRYVPAWRRARRPPRWGAPG
jgi:putative transposase